MAADLFAEPGGGRAGGDPERLRRAMARWRRRSLVIRFWRLALPTLMALIAAAVGTLIFYNSVYGPRPAAERDQQVRMLAPRFLGRDKSGRPFVVTAREAARDPRRPALVSLDHPHLVLEGADGSSPTVVDAALGVYNETSHVLALDGQVSLDDGKRDVVRSEHAIVDTDQGSAEGRTAVVAEGPMGRTVGDAYRVRDRGRDIEFLGHVRTHAVQ